MTAPSIGEIRTALADTIGAALPDVNAYRVPVDNPTPPCVIVAGLTHTQNAQGTGGNLLTFDVFAAVSRRSVDCIDALDALVSPDGAGSVVAAIDADPTLGGVVQDAGTTIVGDYRE